MARPDLIINQDTSDRIVTLIRQKTDSTLNFTYYWKGITKDSSHLESFTFNIENDSFKQVRWYTSWDKGPNIYDEDSPPGFVLASTYQDKQNSSIRLYKYENINHGIDGGRARIFSREYGSIGRTTYSWKKGLLITHWPGQPVNPGYQTLFKDNLEKLYTDEWPDETRLLPGKDKKLIVW